MSLRTAVRVSRAPFTSLGAVGIYWGTFAAAVPAIKEQVGASDAQFGLALIGSAVGGMVAMYFGPFLARVLGRYILPLLTVVMAVVMQLPIFAHSVLFMFLMMICLGTSIASLDINANMRLSQLEERHGLHLMNINHAMFSLAFGLSALGVAWMRRSGFGVADIFPIMGVVVLATILFSWERDWRPVEAEEGQAPAPDGLPWLYILMTAVMLFVSFMGENATESWSALFIERELGGAAGDGSFGPSTLGLVMFMFRMIGQVTTEKLGEERVVFWSGVLGVIGYLVIATAQSQGAVLVGIGISAIGMAVIVPTANSLLGKLVHREQRGVAISRAWFFGFTGFFVGPSMIGLISQNWGLRVAFVFVAVAISTIIPAIYVMKRRRLAEGR